MTRKRLTRRKFLLGAGLVALPGLAYSHLVEPNWLDVGRHEVAMGGASGRGRLKILHLSDLHAGPFISLPQIAKAIEMGLALRPDLACVTGDFVTAVYDYMDSYAQVLSMLSRAVPTFGSLGNHDGGWWSGRNGGWKTIEPVQRLLSKAGIQLLLNQSVSLKCGGWDLTLAGLGDIWSGLYQPIYAFKRGLSDLASCRILLSHNPDTKSDVERFPWDLMLSGHTHGGQLRLPLVGTPFAPVRDKRFVQGLHRWKNRWLHITKGVGNVHGLRFNCRPEISFLTLT